MPRLPSQPEQLLPFRLLNPSSSKPFPKPTQLFALSIVLPNR